MSLPVTFYWTPSDNAAISLSKYVDDDAPIILDGTLSNPKSGTTQIGFNGVSRTVTITSAIDLSAISFTISGKINGFNVRETINGPNANTVSTDEKFSIVESVTFDNSPDAFLSVGSGHEGFTNWFWYDHYPSCANTTVQVNKISDSVHHSIVSTLEDVRNMPEEDLLSLFVSGTADSTGNQYVSIDEPYMFLRVAFGNGTNATGSAKVTILQQGVK